MHPQTVFELGLRLHQQGDVQQLELLLTPALLEFPEDGRLVQLRGIIWHDRGRYDAAQRCLEMAATLVPLAPLAAWCLADCYLRHQFPESAHTILVNLLKRPDVPAELLPHIASGLGKLGDYDAAIEACRLASHRDPENDQPLFGMAWYMHRLNYPLERVIPLMHKAVQLAPDCLAYRLGYAMLLYRTGNWRDAYGPLCEIRPQSITCVRCLERMIDVFDRVGDHPRRDACCAQLLACSRESDRQSN